MVKKRELPKFPTVTDEELIRKAEFLLDSGTQKALRGLAYLRVLRSRIGRAQGSHQFTLTSKPGKGTSPKKKWILPPPKDKTKGNPEFQMITKCFHCKGIFRKTMECKKCKLFVCPHCAKCGCQLSEEARNAVYCILETVFGYVETRSYWR